MSLEKLLGVDKVYCISLLKKQNQWENILLNINKNGFPSCEIFEGVDGNIYKDNLKNMVGIWQQYILENNLQRSNHEQFSTYGAIGCYMSHTNIWKDMLKNRYKKVLIFEDDIWFNFNFVDNLKQRLDWIPENYDFLFLDVATSYSSTVVNKYFNRIGGLFFGMHSYIITENAAKALLPQIFPIEVQIDSYVSYAANLQNLNMYYTRGLCGQVFHFSSIQTPCKMCDSKKSGGLNFTYICIIYLAVIIVIIILAVKPVFSSRQM